MSAEMLNLRRWQSLHRRVGMVGNMLSHCCVQVRCIV